MVEPLPKAGEPPEGLLAYRRNVYSQNGEDGVVEELCRRLDIRQGRFVEVGAWDGKHLSNTHNLLHSNWTGVYIEADPARFEDLLKTKARFPDRIQAIHARVDYRPGSGELLDTLLAGTGLPKDFELLSIDIDSYDRQVWSSLRDFAPKIVIIEVNTRIPPGICRVHGENGKQGASFSSMVALGRDKGYRPVCHTGNLFFVRDELVAHLDLDPRHLACPEALFNYPKHRAELAYGRPLNRLRRALFKLRDRLGGVKRRLLGR